MAELVNYLIAKRRQASRPDVLPPGFAIAAAHALLANRPDPWVGPPVAVRPNPWIGPPVKVVPQQQVIGPVAGSVSPQLASLPPTTGAVTSWPGGVVPIGGRTGYR